MSLENGQYICMKHSSSDKVWTITQSAAARSQLLATTVIDNPNTTDTYGLVIDNPLIISAPDVCTMQLITGYLTYHENGDETPAPDKPLKNVHISVLLGDEYELFKDLYEETDSTRVKLTKLNTFIEAAMYFSIPVLVEKLCAIAASLLKNNTIDELDALSNNSDI